MTYTVDLKEAKLRGMPDVAIVDEIMDNNTGEYLDEDGYMREYQKYLDSLPIYDIEPGEWKGITEVKEGEFLLQHQRFSRELNKWLDWVYDGNERYKWRILARPKPAQVKPVIEDLLVQVRDHIKSDKLFDWHEAMSENEMTYLENLLLTFAPQFWNGSIGFKITVQPHLDEKENEIKALKAECFSLSAEVTWLADKYAISEYKQEIERLKGLIMQMYDGMTLTDNRQQFKSENNL